MKNDPTSLTPFKPVRPAGAARATLALILALLALGTAAFALYENRMREETRPAPDAALHARLRGLETVQVRAEESLAALKVDTTRLAQEAQARVENAVSAPSGGTSATDPGVLEAKLAALTSQSLAMETRLNEALARQSAKLSVLALLHGMHGKIRQGLAFEADLRRIGAVIDSTPSLGAVQALSAYAARSPVSDAVLRDELRPLSADMLAKEKMDQADGLADKVGIQLKKLVTIRPKDGIKPEPEGAASAPSALESRLETLQQALDAQDWEKSLIAADALKPSSPPAYEEWLRKLHARIDAERALAAIEATILTGEGTVPAAAPPTPALD